MENWTVIAVYTYAHEANMAKSVLESVGITVMLKDEMVTQINPFYSNAVGGVKVMVNKSEAEKGWMVLKEGGLVTEEFPAENEVFEVQGWNDKIDCPFCGSINIAKKKYPNKLMVVVFFILGAFFPLFRKTTVCFDCHKEWRNKRV
jgi:transposase-like protein